MRIAVHLHHASHPEPLIRHIDVLVQMNSLGKLTHWMEYISGQTQTKLPDGAHCIHLYDLQQYCYQTQIELSIIRGMDSSTAKRLAKANSRLSGLTVSDKTEELIKRVNSGEITINEAIQELLRKNI